MKSMNKFDNISETDVWNSENIYHLKSDVSRISKLIYHYEIYKKISSIPGDIIECGVFKGVSLTRFLTFREILENSHSRKIYGFDIFGKFPQPKHKNDLKFLKNWQNNSGDGIDKNELNKIFLDKKFSNYELLKGNITKTIPSFIKKYPHVKISLLHLDLDVYEATKFTLEKLYRHVVIGGIILIDDYNTVYGATKAIDEFLANNKSVQIKKLSFNKVPSYFVKT